MDKITRFRDIPQFTKSGSWQADYDLDELVVSLQMAEKSMANTENKENSEVDIER